MILTPSKLKFNWNYDEQPFKCCQIQYPARPGPKVTILKNKITTLNTAYHLRYELVKCDATNDTYVVALLIS